MERTDITNYYLQQGVWGGLPLMALLICAISMGFAYVGKCMRGFPASSEFMMWAIGASLFSHAASCISISYFDQSFMFLYLTLSILASLRASLAVQSSEVPVAEKVREPEDWVEESLPGATFNRSGEDRARV
jgi:hypothetical protein